MQLSIAPQQSGTTADYLDHVRRLKPIILGAAEQMDKERRLTSQVLAGLHEAKLFRLLLPKPYGGGEVDITSFFRIISEVARLDASTAWCLCQANGCAMTAAYLGTDVADAIWGRDPLAVLAWGPGKASAVPHDDGYMVSGNWSFASGARHATWLGGHCIVSDSNGKAKVGPDGTPVIRTMLFSAGQISLRDVWNVIGLRGTASDAYALDGLFVPEEYSVSRDDARERRYNAPLYLFPAMSLYAIGFSGTALGIADAMLESFKDLAVEKTPRLARKRLSENAVIQADFARAQARLGASRAFMLSETSDIWAAVTAENRLTVAQRMRIRLAATYAIHEAKAAADAIYDAAGASAIFESSEFERRFRDLHTVTQQLQGRKTHFETVGAFLLGNPPDMSVI